MTARGNCRSQWCYLVRGGRLQFGQTPPAALAPRRLLWCRHQTCYHTSNYVSHLSPVPCRFLEVGASGLLRAFRSPIFDTSMSRNPSEVFADEFFTGEAPHSATSSSASTPTSPSPRVGRSVDGDDTETRATQRRLSAEGGEWGGVSDSSSASLDSSDASSTSASSARKGGRARRGRKSFKEWQDDSRWDLKVMISLHPRTPATVCNFWQTRRWTSV